MTVYELAKALAELGMPDLPVKAFEDHLGGYSEIVEVMVSPTTEVWLVTAYGKAQE
jgi:hypothetical protein